MSSASTRTVAVRGVVAAAIAAVGNAVLVAIADALSISPNSPHLAYPRVVLFTVVGVLLAAGVYAVLSSRRANPDATFVRVAVVVLVVSFVPDLGLWQTDPTVTAAGAAVLISMHVVAAVVAVFVLTRGVGDAI